MALLAVSTTGCYGVTNGYNIGFLGYPLPVSPYYQHKQEEKFWKKERYEKVPILGPTTSGGPAVALDPPTDDEVMHALESARPVQGGIPLLWEKQRNNVRIIKEKIADYVDPPRFYPLIGPAQLHHAHYKCTIYFDEKTTIGYPGAAHAARPRSDRSGLHRPQPLPHGWRRRTLHDAEPVTQIG